MGRLERQNQRLRLFDGISSHICHLSTASLSCFTLLSFPACRLYLWCDPDILEHANGRLVQCTNQPYKSYCFTSANSGYSNNP